MYSIAPANRAKDTLENKDKRISNILLWTPTHGHISVGLPAKTYIHHLCVDTRCSLEDLPRTMADRDRWQESQGNSYCQAHLSDNDDIR